MRKDNLDIYHEGDLLAVVFDRRDLTPFTTRMDKFPIEVLPTAALRDPSCKPQMLKILEDALSPDAVLAWKSLAFQCCAIPYTKRIIDAIRAEAYATSVDPVPLVRREIEELYGHLSPGKQADIWLTFAFGLEKDEHDVFRMLYEVPLGRSLYNQEKWPPEEKQRFEAFFERLYQHAQKFHIAMDTDYEEGSYPSMAQVFDREKAIQEAGGAHAHAKKILKDIGRIPLIKDKKDFPSARTESFSKQLAEIVSIVVQHVPQGPQRDAEIRKRKEEFILSLSERSYETARFTDDFNHLPEFIREAATATGNLEVIIGNRMNNDASLLTSFRKKKSRTSHGMSDGEKVYFRRQTMVMEHHGSIVREEVVHHIDASLRKYEDGTLRKFTARKAWKKAVDADKAGLLSQPDRKQWIQNYLKEFKGNTLFADAFYKNENYVEALVDIGHIEQGYKDLMAREGNLQSAGFAGRTSVQEAMQTVFPQMWQLYRGPRSGQLYQDKSGNVIFRKPGTPMPEGVEPVFSFIQECAALVQETKGISVSLYDPILSVKGKDSAPNAASVAKPSMLTR
jgi:hypothetical protein